MHKWLTLGSVCALLALHSSAAHAGAQEVLPDRNLALTLAPVRLGVLMAELNAEVRLHRRVGFDVTLGVGSVTLRDGSDPQKALAFNAGAMFETYPIGHFDDGLQLGGGLVLATVRGDVRDTIVGTTFTRSISAVGMGPTIHAGYKHTTSLGIVFTVRGGIGYLLGDASDSDSMYLSGGPKLGAFPVLDAFMGYAF